MPKAWSEKDERQYRHVKKSEKKRGRSTRRAKEIAARTVNKERAEQGRTQARRRSASRNLDEQTKDQLYREAKKLDIHGRSKMNKGQLARAIAKAR